MVGNDGPSPAAATRLRVGLAQMTSTSDMAANIAAAEAMIREALAQGAQWVLTPEATSLLAYDRDYLRRTVRPEDADRALARFREIASELGIWLLIGSLPLSDGDKIANRCFMIAPNGRIAARYDKLHLFDVDLGEGRVYRESAAYTAGSTGELVETPWGLVGLSICYDLRFPHLYRRYAQAGARFLTVPSAFTPWTGEAHWHVLLRARAIETGCFVLAPAQVGEHGGGRATFGHSLVVDPWGRILGDGGDAPGLLVVDLDLDEVETARRKIPSLRHDVAFEIRRNDPV